VICHLSTRPRVVHQTSPNQAPIDKRRLKTIFNHFRDKPARSLKENRTEIRIIGHRYDYVNWIAWNPCTVDPSNATQFSNSDGFTCMEPRYDNSYLDWIHKEGIEVRADQDLSAGLYDVQWQSIIARAST
jgi:hypothetical protein